MPDKPKEIYNAVKNIIPMLPKDEVTKFPACQAVEQINTKSASIENLRIRMDEVAKQLPEYPAMLVMKVVNIPLIPS